MGGHGALICALKNPGLYKSVSAFAPICNPSKCPWGIKAFTGYLGPQESAHWEEWDATELVKKYNGPPLELLLDQVKYNKYIGIYISIMYILTFFIALSQDNTNTLVMNHNHQFIYSYFFIIIFIYFIF